MSVVGNIMHVVQSPMEKLRPLVGLKGWDYCVLWKLREDQRYIEWIDCCCAGTDQEAKNSGEELQFPLSPVLPCKDVIFQHPRAKSCELLSQVPSSISLDSGIYAQTLMSNIPRWLHLSSCSESSVVEETVGTKALIPIPGGIIELFVTKQVPEDQQIIDFVASQCNFLIVDQEVLISSTNMGDQIFQSEHSSKPFLADEQKDRLSHFQSPVSPLSALENLDLPYDINVDRVRLCNVSATGLENLDMQFMECLANKQQQQQQLHGNDKDYMKQDIGRSDSISDCSDQIDDIEDDAKYGRKNGEGPQSKNLHAERRRRKRLNDRLYDLRALVPKISKLNKASILGDAIEFVKELQQQEKDLQDELEEHSDDEGAKNNNHNNIPSEILSQNGVNLVPRSEVTVNGFPLGASGNCTVSKQNQGTEITHDKGQQMEPQVEVAQMDGNEYFVKVFCEHKPGGFVRLMEALESLGLEVTNVNVTSFRTLVSNVFIVKKRDSEMVQVDYVRDSLLELTRNPCRGWPEMDKEPENCDGMDYHQHYHHIHDGHIDPNHHQFHHHHN